MQKHRSSEESGNAPRPVTSAEIANQSQRQRIIDAMIEACAAKTYAAMTITDIVSRAHISRTTFYKHYEDKRDCFEATIDFCIAELQGVAGDAHSPADSPGDAARLAAEAVVEALAARPGLANVLTGEAMAVDPRVIERYRRATVPALEALWGGPDAAQAHTDPRLAFGQAQVLIFNQIATGNADRLTEVLPEIVYLTVSPFGGHEEALRQSRLAGRAEIGGAPSR